MSNITSLLRFLLPEKHVDSFLPHWSFSFYHFQFFSNLFKYSVSNFLSSYLYNIFTIYFSSDSSLLKSHSSTISNFSCCYNIVKSEAAIFFIYSSGFYIGFYFGFTFLILMMMMKRHVTLQSHNMSHDVMS